jgi:hypothetical protein
MALIPKIITAGSEQTIAITGATTYDFYGMTITNTASIAEDTTITIKNSSNVTVYNQVYLKGFPDNFIPGSPGESPWKKVAPISGPIKVNISGSVSGKCNFYYEKRT